MVQARRALLRYMPSGGTDILAKQHIQCSRFCVLLQGTMLSLAVVSTSSFRRIASPSATISDMQSSGFRQMPCKYRRSSVRKSNIPFNSTSCRLPFKTYARCDSY